MSDIYTWWNKIHHTIDDAIPYIWFHETIRCCYCYSAEPHGFTEELPTYRPHRRPPTPTYTPVNTQHTSGEPHSIQHWLEEHLHLQHAHIRPPMHTIDPHYIMKDGRIFRTYHARSAKTKHP